jgi:sugar lactone lactonase YvrE
LGAALGLLVALGTSFAGTTAQAQNVQFLPEITTVAGSGTAGYTGDGGNALAATISSSADAAVTDSYGNIYIADQSNNVIRRVDAATGIITTVAGGGSGTCATVNDALGDNCPATQAILKGPKDVRIFRGDLYIADNGDNYIRMVSGATGIISIYAGTGATAAPSNNVLATDCALPAPQALIFDPAGNAFIATAGGKVYVVRVDAVSHDASIYAGIGTAGITGDNGAATSAKLQNIGGLAMDSHGNLFISETTPNNVREVLASNGNIITYVGKSGSSTSGFAGDGTASDNALLNGNLHISIDAQDNLYIADSGNNRIRVVTPPAIGATYGIINTLVAGPGFTGDGGPVSGALVNTPRDIESTNTGDLLIMDQANDRVRMISPAGRFASTAVGSMATQTLYVQVNTPLTLGSFNVPAGYPDLAAGTVSGCAVGTALTAGTVCSVQVTFKPTLSGLRSAPLNFTDSNGNIYTLPLTGIGNAPAASLLPSTISTIAGTGTAGASGNGASATAALLNQPAASVVDGQGNIYFADTANNEVREISQSTATISAVAGTGAAGFSGDGSAAVSAQLNAPGGLAVDGAGDLYIADTGNNRIRFVSAATHTISTFAGMGTAGFAGDGGLATLAELNAPQGLFITAAGTLYIADTGNNAVRAVGLTSNTITTLAGNGTAGFAGDGGSANSAQLSAPTAVVADAYGNLFIADTNNHRIREIAAYNSSANNLDGLISSIAGEGTAGFNGDGVAATAYLDNPSGLAVDAAGNLYVADTGNNLVREISGGQIRTVAGTGTAGYTGDGAFSTAAALNAPQAISLDGSGDLLIADTANQVLREVNVTASTLSFPTTSPGTDSTGQTIWLLNTGNQALALSNVSVPANFVEQSSGGVDCNATALSLAPGATCAFSLAFTPPAVTSFSGNVTITDNAQGSATSTQTISLSGVGAYVYSASLTLPQNVTAGDNQSVTVTVTNPASAYTGTLHFTSSDPKAVPPPDYTFTTADNGSHTFSGIQFRTAGIQSLTMTDTVKASITASASTMVVGGAATALVVVSGNSQAANIGANYTAPLVVEATDQYGNASAGTSVTFTAPASGATATFAGKAIGTAVTNSAGMATSPSLLADNVTGTFTVQAAASGVSPAQFSLSNTSTVPALFTLTASPSSIVSLPPGSSGTVTVTETPVGGFNGAVAISCSTPIATTTCKASTSNVAANGTGAPQTFQVTVTTQGPATSSIRSMKASGIWTCMLLCSFGVGFVRKRKRWAAMVVLLLAAGLGLSGCGSEKTGTPQTVFNVTVTGTSGSLSSSVQIACYVAGESAK